MSGELDAEVAEKIMGWKRGGLGESRKAFWISGEHFQFGIDRAVGEDIYSYEGLECHGWLPSGRIADAWLVVEKMASLGHYLHLNQGDLSKKWCATFFSSLLDCTGDSGSVATAPLAICLAALKAVSA